MPQSYYKRHLCAGLYHATIQLYLIYLIINKTLFRRGHSITERRRRRGRSEVMLLGVSLFSFSSITEESWLIWNYLMKTKHSVALQPKLTNIPIGLIWSAEPEVSPHPFYSYKKSTVYLNLIPVKLDLNRSENAEVAFTGNSWRTLVPCLSLFLPRVENSAVQTGSRHIPHTVWCDDMPRCKNTLQRIRRALQWFSWRSRVRTLELLRPCSLHLPIKHTADRYPDSYRTPFDDSKWRGFIVHLSTHFQNINLNTFGEWVTKVLQ